MGKTVTPSMPVAEACFEGGFCVLMAVYARDEPALFERALASVLDNTLLPDQFVLVVDGPVPAALEQVIGALAQRPTCEVMRLEDNVGLALALNAGLQRVRTEWTVRADADDLNLPHRFAALARCVAEHPNVSVLGSAILEVDRDGSALSVRRPPLSHADIQARLPLRNPFNHMAVAYRTMAVRAVGGYPPVHLMEDYALWCTLACDGVGMMNLPEVLVHATTGADMYRRRGGWRYIRSEFAMQRAMVSLGLKRPASACLHGLARGLVFALPGWARGILYRRLLRTGAHLT